MIRMQVCYILTASFQKRFRAYRQIVFCQAKQARHSQSLDNMDGVTEVVLCYIALSRSLECYVQVCSEGTSTNQNHALLHEVKMHSTVVQLSTSIITADKRMHCRQNLIQYYTRACS